MFQRLVNHAYWRTANCILVWLGGVPTRACRCFIRRLADDKKLPMYVFVDGNPYGYSNIYRTLKVGSGNAGNTATDPVTGAGGGLYCGNHSALTLDHCTFDDANASQGGLHWLGFHGGSRSLHRDRQQQ